MCCSEAGSCRIGRWVPAPHGGSRGRCCGPPGMAIQALLSVSARVSASASMGPSCVISGGCGVGLNGTLVPSQEAGLEHDLVRFYVLKTQPLKKLCGQHMAGEVEGAGPAERRAWHRVHVACEKRRVTFRESVDRGPFGDDAPEQAVAVLDRALLVGASRVAAVEPGASASARSPRGLRNSWPRSVSSTGKDVEKASSRSAWSASKTSVTHAWVCSSSRRMSRNDVRL